MAKVFISYRRIDTDDKAEILFYALLGKLREVYAEEDILFKDTHHIPSGSNWAEVIREELDAVGIVLVVIGEKWAEEIRRRGQPNMSEEIDWVVEEIATALEMEKTIISVLVGGIPFPDKAGLPTSIHPLFDYQLTTIDFRGDYHRDDDIEKLVAHIRQELKKLPHLPLPADITTPAIPYKEMVFFTQEDARVFFGRSEAIMDLYERIHSKKTRLTLYYGQTGVGKTSVLRAGLIPRLERAWGIEPEIIRREREEGISNQIENILPGIPKEKKYLLVLDQLEEIYTDKNKAIPNEGDQFASKVTQLIETFPHLRIILSFRKEWLADIEDLLKTKDLKFNKDYRKLYLKPLDFEGVMEAIEGASYLDYGLTIVEGLATKIANNIMQDEDSHVAPLLQMQLRNMWDEACVIDEEEPKFTEELYEKVSTNNLEEMLEKVLRELEEKFQPYVEIGLVLNVLKFYTTDKGTATDKTDRELQEEFGHIPDVFDLKNALKNSYLLTEPAEKKEIATRLAHDTLARIIQEKYLNSPRVGQQATRLLENKKQSIEKEAYEQLFTAKDIEVLEKGRAGMRQWNEKEQKAFDVNREALEEAEKTLQEKITLSVSALSNTLVNAAKLVHSEKKYSKAIRLAELAYETFPNNNEAFDVLTKVQMQLGYQRELQGHTKGVTAIQFSPDGQRIVTASMDETAKLWDANGHFLYTFEGHTNGISTVQFSPDGQQIATASEDGTAKLWNTSGQCLHTLEGHTDIVIFAQFSPDGHQIVTASEDKTVKLWNVNGQLLHTFEGYTEKVNFAQFSPDGQRIATASWDGIAKIWDTKGQLLHTLEGNTFAQFSASGQRIVTDAGYQTVKVWDANGELLHTLEGHTNVVDSAQFSPDGRHIVTTSWDGTAKIWDATGQLLYTLEGHTEGVTSAQFSPDGQQIVTASWDGTAKIWDATAHFPNTLDGHLGRVTSAQFSPDGQQIVTASWDGTAKIWDAATQLMYTLEGHLGVVTSAQFSPDGRQIVTASWDETAKIWDAESQLLHDLKGHMGIVTSAQFSPDNQQIVTASEDGTFKLWNAEGQLLYTLEGHAKKEISSAQFSPDGRQIITASWDGTAKIWKTNGQLLYTLEGHTNVVNSAQFSPDGGLIVTASWDGTAKIWKTNGQVLHTLEGHAKGVNSAQFSPDGRQIVTASEDGTAKIWDVIGRLLHTLEGHTKRVYFAQFSPDGQQIVTASGDETSKLWNLDIQGVIQNLNDRSIAFLTAKELEENDIDTIDQAAGTNRVERLLREDFKFKIYQFALYYQEIARKNPAQCQVYLQKAKRLYDYLLEHYPLQRYREEMDRVEGQLGKS